MTLTEAEVEAAAAGEEAVAVVGVIVAEGAEIAVAVVAIGVEAAAEEEGVRMPHSPTLCFSHARSVKHFMM